MTPTQLSRFMKKVEVATDGCWNWIGSRTTQGYGRVARNQRPEPAHREMYEHAFGPIPPKHDIDHLCRNPSCVNPDHLEAVMRRENARRGLRGVLAPTHCPHGHEFTEDNTGRRRGSGHRYCKACGRIRARAWKAALPKVGANGLTRAEGDKA